MYGEVVVIRAAGGEGGRMPMDTPRLTIGRDDACDIRVRIKEVSRRQAALDARDGCVWLTNESGTNPTLLGGAPLSAPTPLRHGDVLEISGRKFRWEYGAWGRWG